MGKFTGRVYTSKLQRELYGVALGYSEKPVEITIQDVVDDNWYPPVVTAHTAKFYAMAYRHVRHYEDDPTSFGPFGVALATSAAYLTPSAGRDDSGPCEVDLGVGCLYDRRNFGPNNLAALMAEAICLLDDHGVEIIETRRCGVKVYPNEGLRTVVPITHDGTACFLCRLAGVTHLENETYVWTKDITRAIGKNREELINPNSLMNQMGLVDPLRINSPDVGDLNTIMDEIDRLGADHIKVCRSWQHVDFDDVAKDLKLLKF